MNTKQVEVSQRIDFSCSYVVNLGNNVYQLNSHYYKFEATVANLENYDENGRVISFETLKRIMEQIVPDEMYLYNDSDINQVVISISFAACGFTCYNFDEEVSTERILNYISLTLVDELKKYKNLYLKETKLRENNNSYVSWKQEV